MGDLTNMTSMYGLTLSDQLGAQQMIFNFQMQQAMQSVNQMQTMLDFQTKVSERKQDTLTKKAKFLNDMAKKWADTVLG